MGIREREKEVLGKSVKRVTEVESGVRQFYRCRERGNEDNVGEGRQVWGGGDGHSAEKCLGYITQG